MHLGGFIIRIYRAVVCRNSNRSRELTKILSLEYNIATAVQRLGFLALGRLEHSEIGVMAGSG